MSNQFAIKRASTAGTPAQPDADYRPTIEAPPIVHHPDSQDLDPRGYPCAEIGKPWAEIGRSRASSDCLTYYNALYPSSTAGSSYVKVELLDLRDGTWKVYEGVLHRYTLSSQVRSGTHPFVDLRIRITQLVESSW